jgi:hypothetical protein
MAFTFFGVFKKRGSVFQPSLRISLRLDKKILDEGAVNAPKPDKTEGPVWNEKQRVSMHLWAAETEDPLPAFPDQPDPVDKVESTEPCRERPKPDKTEGPVLNEKQ